MKRRHHLDGLSAGCRAERWETMKLSSELGDFYFGLEEGLRCRFAQGHNDFGLDTFNLPKEEGDALDNLVWFWDLALGWTALDEG